MTSYFEPSSDETNPQRWHFDWYGDHAVVEQNGTGTGTVGGIAAQGAQQYSTGATSGGTAQGRYLIGGSAVFAIGLVRRLEINWSQGSIDAGTKTYAFITSEFAATEPSLTSDHIGVRQNAGAMLFSTADGTAEQTTDISVAIVAGQVHNIVAINDGTTVLCYVDGVLRATHRTRVPRSTPLTALVVMRWFIINSVNVNKAINLFHFGASIATN